MENKEESGWGSWVIRKISNNIEIRLKNVNIALEHQRKLCSVKIEEIIISSCNHLWESAFVDPGKFNFMRKFCSVKGFQISLDDSPQNSNEKQTIKEDSDPVLQSLDLVIRLVLIKERLSPDLPDNRVDILCLNTPSVCVTVEQYNSMIQILKRFLAFRKKNKQNESPPLSHNNQQATHFHPHVQKVNLNSSNSSPSVFSEQKENSELEGSQKQRKGWFSWVVRTLTEEQDQEMM